MKTMAVVAAVVAAMVLGAQFITIFVTQPIGALPDGATVIVTRGSRMMFIDSPDGWCERNNGGVSLPCRGAAMAGVAEHRKILLRLPYSSTLYSISTGGRFYDR